MTTLISFCKNGSGIPFAIDDRIFLGEGLFETMQVINGRVRYPEQHWQRLKKAAFFLGLPFEIPFKLWIEKLDYYVQLIKLNKGGIKAILSGGRAPRGLLQQSHESHLVFDAFLYTNATRALSLISAPWKRDEKNPLYQLKSVNYLEAIVARRHAQAKGADDALFFNFRDQATETTVANLFIIKNNQILTPALKCGVLPGIIRQRLLTLCKEHGIACFEHQLDKILLNQAEAAFTSNALQGIQAIASWDDCVFDIEHPFIGRMQALLINDN